MLLPLAAEGGFAVGYGPGGYNQNVASLALSDGSVLFTPYDNSFNSVIGKLGPDGQLDTSFGIDGYFESSSTDLYPRYRGTIGRQVPGDWRCR